MVRVLLTNRETRFIRLLENGSQGSWLSLSMIAHHLGCSEKTVRNDVQILVSAFPDLVIETSFLGYRLKSEGIAKAIHSIRRNSVISRLLKQLLLRPGITMSQVMIALDETEGNLRGAIKQFNSSFATKEISIQRKPLRMVGKDHQVMTIYYMLMKNQNLALLPTFLQQMKLMEKLVERLFLKNHELAIRFGGYRQTLKQWLLIAFLREQVEPFVGRGSNTQLINYMVVMDQLISKQFQNIFSYKLSNNVLNRIVPVILGDRILEHDIQLICKMVKTEESEVLVNRICGYYQEICKKLGLKHSKEDFVKLMTNGFISPKEEFNLQTHEVLVLLLQEEHHDYLVKHKNDEWFESYLYKDLLVETAYLLQRNFGALVNRLKNIELKVRTGIYFIDDEVESLLIYEYLKTEFHDILECQMLSTDELVSQPFELLVTNLDRHDTDAYQVVKISKLPTSQHGVKIKKLYNKHILKQVYGDRDIKS